MLKYNLNAQLGRLEWIGVHSCTVERIGMLEMPDIQGRSCGHETPAKKAEPEINTIPRKDNTIPQEGELQYKERRSGG